MKINHIRPQEHEFTEVLENIALTPKMLYYYGNLPIATPDGLDERVQNPCRHRDFGTNARAAALRTSSRPSVVAIVGTRKNTAYGEEVAFRAAYELAKRGAVVISGLALGIDSIAHRGALAAGGRTVAVLGTPIDRIYPLRHTSLAREIIEKEGAVISEYAPGTKLNFKLSFLERNRLIAGMADVVLVVEANERSGSLNTAMHAIEQGRELFAVPGDITRPLSLGCNKLISQGAQVYNGPEDILRLLFPEDFVKKRRKTAPLGDTPAETAILGMLFTGVKDGDEIVDKTGIEVAKFNQTITMLEIKGRVKALGANQWGLIG